MLLGVESRPKWIEMSGKCLVPEVVVLEVRGDSLFVASVSCIETR
jgi:hypothetical protein